MSITVRCAERAPQKRTCATSAPADARRERGRSALGRRDARIAAQGRQAATGGIPTEPDAAHGRMRRAPLAARASGGGVTAARKRPRARANRGGERPRSRAPSAQRRGPRCDRTRTQSGDCGAVRAGSGTPSARGEARLGRSPPHADRHHTHGTHTAPHTHDTHKTPHAREHVSCHPCAIHKPIRSGTTRGSRCRKDREENVPPTAFPPSRSARRGTPDRGCSPQPCRRDRACATRTARRAALRKVAP